MAQILFGLAMIGVAIAFGVEAANYSPTAARMPGLLAWVVGLLAAAMTAEAALERHRAKRAAPAELPVHPSEEHEGGSLPRALLFLGLFVLYTLSFQTVGFVLASIVFLGGVLLLFRATRPLLALVTVASALTLIYGVFVAFLRLPVPLWPRF